MQNSYFCVLGNHELMIIKSHKNEQEKKLWLCSGGEKTLSSYAELDDEVFEAHIEYFKTLPYFLHFEIEGHKPLVVSHSYLHHIWVNQEYRYSENDADDIIWRHMNNNEYFTVDKEVKNGIFNIFGHTTVYNAVITDTGAVYANNKYLGILSAIHYPSLEVRST